MKTIFAIRGKSNAGKSTTVKRVKALLMEHFPDATWEPKKERKGKGDIYGILIINGIKIGIEGQGDLPDWLMDVLEEFERDGCEIIVCTDRTRRIWTDPIGAMKTRGYEIRLKPKSPSPEDQWQANDEAIAREIVNEIAAELEQAAA